MHRLLWSCLSTCLWACAPELSAPPKSPQTESFARKSDWKPGPLVRQTVLVPEPAGVPSPGAECQSYTGEPSASCTPSVSGRVGLASALADAAPVSRDGLLACLESSSDLPPGFVRALRAELAPEGCADTLTLPLLVPRRPELERRMADTLRALAIAARLSRLVRRAPGLESPQDKSHFMQFFQSTLKPWIVSQSQAIEELSSSAAGLIPYGKGIVAVAAGLADMRFVAVVRDVALPTEMERDPELKNAYYAALDEALEPRKVRGRDAALVGLRELASEGVVAERRVSEARALLSQVYSGRRIDALDRLLLPSLPAPLVDTIDRKLAAELPTFYAGTLLDRATLDADLLRALLSHGVPQAFVLRLDPDQLDDASKSYLARGLFDRGRAYFRAADFSASARLSVTDPTKPESALLHALADTLKNGPRDASDLLLAGPFLPTSTGDVSELDQLAAQKGVPSAALATFDAAYLRSLVPPQNDAPFWDDLATRFDAAERALSDPSQKKQARESSLAAKDTAKTLRANRPPRAGSTPARDSAK